jgi:hypothetical protein
VVSFQATKIEIKESFILATGPRMLRSKADNKRKSEKLQQKGKILHLCLLCTRAHKTKQNINNNDNETINYDEMALLSCAIKYEKIEQMVKMFRTHRCAFDFDRKFCNTHVNEIKIEAKNRGRSALAASS